MQSLLLIYANEQVWTESQHAPCYAESTGLANDLHDHSAMNDAGTGTKSKVKEKLGHAANDPKTETEGTDEKVGGKIQKKVGDVEKVVEK